MQLAALRHLAVEVITHCRNFPPTCFFFLFSDLGSQNCTTQTIFKHRYFTGPFFQKGLDFGDSSAQLIHFGVRFDRALALRLLL